VEGGGAVRDKELIAFVRSFRRGILAGQPSDLMCAAVCWPLETLLNMQGVKCRSVESKLEICDHIWLLMADGRALDPTADQLVRIGFPHLKLPPVYLGPRTEAHTHD
jgi:hypothetical protein